MTNEYEVRHLDPDEVINLDNVSAIKTAYDLGKQQGFYEGYEAGLKYAITKAKEHLTHDKDKDSMV